MPTRRGFVLEQAPIALEIAYEFIPADELLEIVNVLAAFLHLDSYI